MLFKARKNTLYDALHHGVVYICMGATLAGSTLLCYMGYKYFTTVKPNLRIQHLKKIKEAGEPETVDAAKSIANQW